MVRHRVNKIRFKGSPAKTISLTRQLTKNFLEQGKITTTEKRVKVLKTEIEVLVYKAISNKNSDRNFLLGKLEDKKVIARLVGQIAPVFKSRVGGYVRVVKLTDRDRDGAKIARLEWTEPIVKEDKKVAVTVKKPVPVKPKKNTKTTVKAKK